VSKPAAPAKNAKPARPAARPAAKPAAAKNAAKAPAAPKAAPKAAAKPASKPVTKPTSAATPRSASKAVPKPAPKPAAPSSPLSKSAAHAAPSAAAPAPAPAAASHGSFTDRFAPLRPTVPVPTESHMPVKPARKIDPKLANAWKTKTGRELTEDELLAMPDGEYMNDKQLDFFRNRLQQQKDDLLSNADQTTENLREDTTIVPDPADRATIEEEHALELRTRDRERKLLKKIAQSLARIEAGDYGYCDETGEPIGVARLLARPTATLSLEAQQRRELKQKMFGN